MPLILHLRIWSATEQRHAHLKKPGKCPERGGGGGVVQLHIECVHESVEGLFPISVQKKETFLLFSSAAPVAVFCY